jgi:hypothetical protein
MVGGPLGSGPASGTAWFASNYTLGSGIVWSDDNQTGAFTMVPADTYTDFAWECARLAELTDNQEIRNHLQTLALHRMAEAAPEKDGHSNVILFVGERSSG